MLKKLIIFLLMALVTSVNAESNETVEEESTISTIGGILQIKKDEVGLKSFCLDQCTRRISRNKNFRFAEQL